jgi:hypothetical protein
MVSASSTGERKGADGANSGDGTSVQTPVMVIETGAERRGGLPPAGMIPYRWVRAPGVEARYIWYPHAFHAGGWNDDYKVDYMRRLLAWFDHGLKGEPLPEWFNVKPQLQGVGRSAG